MQHLWEAGHYSTGTRNLGKNPPCNAEDNLRAGLIIIEAWFRGYCGSPGLGGLRTAGLSPLAGLSDYEDTRLNTPSRVRMGLYLAWKASLGNTDMYISSFVTDLV